MHQLDSDELVPEDGKDDVYDNIMSEINDLEEELKAELKKIRKETGLDATYWHSAQGTKVGVGYFVTLLTF